MRRVKAGNCYRFEPVLLDVIDSRTPARAGDIVRVVNLPGCPRANTMQHAHIENPQTGEFLGLVHIHSLQRVR